MRQVEREGLAFAATNRHRGAVATDSDAVVPFKMNRCAIPSCQRSTRALCHGHRWQTTRRILVSSRGVWLELDGSPSANCFLRIGGSELPPTEEPLLLCFLWFLPVDSDV